MRVVEWLWSEALCGPVAVMVLRGSLAGVCIAYRGRRQTVGWWLLLCSWGASVVNLLARVELGR